jgi:hypothetical protein
VRPRGRQSIQACPAGSPAVPTLCPHGAPPGASPADGKESSADELSATERVVCTAWRPSRRESGPAAGPRGVWRVAELRLRVLVALGPRVLRA